MTAKGDKLDIVPYRSDEPPFVCIQVNENWLPALYAMIYPFRYPERWLGTLDENKQARADVLAILNQLMQAGECGEMNDCCTNTTVIDHRISPDDRSTLQISIDGGLTWQTDPADPRRGIIMPLPNIPNFTFGVSRCDRAVNAVQFLQGYVNTSADRTGTILEIVAQIAIDLLALLLVSTGAAAALALLVFPIAQAIKTLGSEVYKGIFTTEVWDAVKCSMYCSLDENGNLTRDGFALFTQHMLTTVPGGPAPLGALSQLIYMANAIGYEGMVLALNLGDSNDATCDDCTCGCDAAFDVWEGQGTILDFGDDADGHWIEVHANYDVTYWGGYGFALVASGEFDCCRVNKTEITAGDKSGGQWVYTICGNALPVFGSIAFSVTGLIPSSSVAVNAFGGNSPTDFTIKVWFKF